jgi:hypothetical protein
VCERDTKINKGRDATNVGHECGWVNQTNKQEKKTHTTRAMTRGTDCKVHIYYLNSVGGFGHDGGWNIRLTNAIKKERKGRSNRGWLL